MNATQLSKKMTKLGRKGGQATKRKHGKRYFSRLSMKRKAFHGGRKPSKPNGISSDQPTTPNPS